MYRYPYDLDTPILEFPDEAKECCWTIRDTLTHLICFGSTGSGKTSAISIFFIKKLLKLGYGGIVLVAKPDELAMWKEAAKLSGRQEDLIIVGPGQGNHFNICNYLSKTNRPNGITITESIVETLQTVLQSSQQKSGKGNDDWFWEGSLTQLITFAVDLSIMATDKLTVQDLYNIVLTAPNENDDNTQNDRTDNFQYFFKKAQEKVDRQIESFKTRLSTVERKSFQSDAVAYENAIFEAIPDALLLRQIHNFFYDSYKNLSSKTKSIISFSFSNFLFSLLREPIYSLFSSTKESNYSPEACYEGKVIILNIATKTYNKFGRDAQVMFKYITQQAWEKRNLEDNNRPLFIYGDEAQQFIHPGDQQFQATCRSNRISVIYLTQNLPNFYASMGGAKSEYNVKALLANFNSKLFLCNGDTETNNLSSEVLGSVYKKDKQWSNSISGSFTSSQSESFKLEKNVRPDEFVSQLTGGPQSNFVVSGYFHRQGRPFKDGTNFKKVYFSQL